MQMHVNGCISNASHLSAATTVQWIVFSQVEGKSSKKRNEPEIKTRPQQGKLLSGEAAQGGSSLWAGEERRCGEQPLSLLLRRSAFSREARIGEEVGLDLESVWCSRHAWDTWATCLLFRLFLLHS
jgi:hypothetical protein